MKILFLNPPTKDQCTYIREGRCMQLTSSWAAIWPPLTLIQMAAIVKQDGHEAAVFDSNVQEVEFDKVTDLVEGYDVLVLNTSFPTIDTDLEVARMVKAKLPDVVILSFGVFYTLIRDESLPEDKSVDYALVGEPDMTLKELVQALAKGGDPEEIRKIPGLLYYDKNGEKVFTGERELIDDLDSLPLPDRSLIHNERHVLPNNGQPFTLVNTSRGCPFPCTFCIVKAYYGQRVRRHSTKYMLDEIEHCQEKYGLKYFLLWEEAFTLDRNIVIEFCNGLKERGLKVNWAVTTRADTVDTEILELMKETGCFLVGMGIESAHQHILDRAKKKEKIEDIVRGVKLARKVGLPVMGHFIFGLPGETKETAEATIKFAKKIGLTYLQSYCAVPYPGTEFGEEAAREGWVTTKEWSRYNFGGESIVTMPGLTPEDITYFRRKAFRKFYFRPGKILSEMRKLSNWRAFKQALNFLRWTK